MKKTAKTVVQNESLNIIKIVKAEPKIDTYLSRYNVRAISANNVRQGVIENGQDNLFGEYLQSLYNRSVTHQNVVNDLVDYIVGYGIKAKDPIQQAIIDKLFNKKVIEQITRDLIIWNEISIEPCVNALDELIKIKRYLPTQIRCIGNKEGDVFGFKFRKSWNKDIDSAGFNVTKDLYIFDFKNPENESLYRYFESGTFETPYGRPRYISALDAIELEIAIYMMQNHGAQQGMFPSGFIILPDSGDPEKNKEAAIEAQRQMTGPGNAGKVGVLFANPSSAFQPQFVTPNLSGIDKVYSGQFETAEIGILKGHAIPSASLISGLNQKPTGFANPAEEMQWAKNELKSKIINPKREVIIEFLTPLMQMAGVEGFEFWDVENANKTTALSSQSKCQVHKLIELGEDEDLENYDLISVERIEGQPEDIEPTFTALAQVIESNPSADSKQDTRLFKVRYGYAGSESPQREFCKQMMSAKKVYRMEDVTAMSSVSVNPGLGPNGADTYDIWLYKGGAQCYHFWERKIYLRKNNEKISVNEARKMINAIPVKDRDRNRLEVNDKKVAKLPIDMPNRGFLNKPTWLKVQLKKAQNEIQ